MRLEAFHSYLSQLYIEVQQFWSNIVNFSSKVSWVHRTTGMVTNIVSCSETVHKVSIQVKKMNKWSAASDVVML